MDQSGIVTHDIEAESLPAHIAICQQRYHNLEVRLNGLEKRIERIEGLVEDIHRKIDGLAQRQTDKWDRTQVAAIAALVSLITFLASRLLA